jgi:predicted nucleotidyltransferase
MNDSQRAELGRFISALHTHYSSRLHGVLVFGSRARGDARPDSDIDLAVILRGEVSDYWDEKLLPADLSLDALLHADLLIQSFPISLDQWEAPETHVNPAFVARAKKDAVSVGEVV